MQFNTPAGINPIDRQTVIGRPTTRIDGPLKTTGAAPYAYERHDVVAGQAYGCIVHAAIAKGRIASIDMRDAKAAPGVRAIVTGKDVGVLGTGDFNKAKVLANPDVQHYHQAVAIVVADSFEQATAAAALVRVEYVRAKGSYDLGAVKGSGIEPENDKDSVLGDFSAAFAAAPVTVDASYTTPDQSHVMMEPFATIAAWEGDRLTLWTSIQIVSWGKRDMAKVLGIPPENIHISSPYIGGGFGAKGSVLADAVMAALAAKVAGRPVKVSLQRPMMVNNTSHRPATIQRIRIGANKDGRITAIGHDNWCGNLPGGKSERSTLPTQSLYAGPNRLIRSRLALLDLPEGNAMRAPGEAPGMMALEVAMDEMAEKLGMDPVAFRLLNDTQVDPGKPERRFSSRKLAECLTTGADRFGWANRNARPGKTRDGRWLVGMGMSSAIRGNPVHKSAARIRLDRDGKVTVETDMTDIGTGSYTIIAQTAAEMMGVPLDQVVVRLADSSYPVTPGSGGQAGANSSTAGVYAACMKLRQTVAQTLGFDPGNADFANGEVLSGNRRRRLGDAARSGEIVVEDVIDYGDIHERFAHHAFGAHFVEVGVDSYTGEIRIRRMLAVCAAGRILNPVTARSQVIGAMTMGVGGALLEELAIDKRFGFFVNHDMASYEVPVHADIPYQDVIFVEELDPMASPMKGKGVGELGMSGVAPAVANAVYHATGIRVRDYPLTLDRYLDKLPAVA